MDDMKKMAALDWVVVGLYGVFLFGVAYWAFRKVKDCGSFLVGSRKMSKWHMMAASFAGGTNANHPMSVAAASFQKGLPGVWLSLTWMLVTPFFWMYPPVIRRLRIVTMADIVRMRFGSTMNYMFKVVALLTAPISMAFGLKSAGVVLEVMTGGAVDGSAALWWIAVPTLVYTLMGGVIAAYTTDIWQGLLIVVLSFLLIPFAIHKAGSVQELDAAVANEFSSLFAGVNADFGFWWIFWFAIGCMFSAVLSSVGGAAAAATERTARMGVFGSITKRFCTIGWAFAGLFAMALFASNPNLVADSGIPGAGPNNAFPVASAELLPVGLRGLMVASMLAAVMSSLDAGLLGFGGMFVNNFYQEHFVKNASPKHYLLVTRIAAVVGIIIAALIAEDITDLVEFATIVEPLSSLTGVAILVALMWRRTTGWGAIASVVVACPLFLAANRPEWPNWIWLQNLLNVDSISLFDALHLRPLADYMAGLYGLELTNPDMGWVKDGVVVKLPVQIKYPMYLIPTVLTLVVVSLFTKQHNKRSVDEFYCRLDTPVGQEGKIREAGFEVDQLEHLDHKDPELNQERVEKGSHDGRLLLADLFYLPRLLKSGEAKWSDYRWDLIGLVVSILFVTAFLFGVDALGKAIFGWPPLGQ